MKLYFLKSLQVIVLKAMAKALGSTQFNKLSRIALVNWLEAFTYNTLVATHKEVV